MSKIITNYNNGDQFPASDANQTFVASNNILMDIAQKNAVSIEESNNNALINGLNSLTLCREVAFNVSGSANQIILTTNTNYSSLPITKYTPFLKFSFFAQTTNTGSITIRIDGLADIIAVRPNGNILNAGDIVSGAYIEAIYNNTTNRMVIVQGLAPVGGNIIKYTDIIFTRASNTTLTSAAGKINAQDNSQYINILSKTLNFSVTGLNARSTNTTLSINTWYYIFACIKLDGTADYIIDSRSNGSDALIDFTTLGYLGSTMTIAGVWLTDGSNNLIVMSNRQPLEYCYAFFSLTQLEPTTVTNLTVRVPTGYLTIPYLVWSVGAGSSGVIYASLVDLNDNITQMIGRWTTNNDMIIRGSNTTRTNISAQVGYFYSSNTSVFVEIGIEGFKLLR